MTVDKHSSKKVHEKRRAEDEKLDQAIDDSFPASDPPPTSPTTTGAPKQADDAKREAAEKTGARGR